MFLQEFAMTLPRAHHFPLRFQTILSSFKITTIFFISLNFSAAIQIPKMQTEWRTQCLSEQKSGTYLLNSWTHLADMRTDDVGTQQLLYQTIKIQKFSLLFSWCSNQTWSLQQCLITHVSLEWRGKSCACLKSEV